MKEHLISFKTSKLVKEIGFESEDSENYYNEYGTINEYTYSNQFTKFPLVTQSLLQKWFREKHKVYLTIHVCHHPILDKVEWTYNLDKSFPKLTFNTYEDALEIGLFETAKLLNEKYPEI
jgi:hypothetical protein